MNLLLEGDCLELMKDIKDESIDLILTDLPYAVTYAGWDSLIPFDAMWEAYNRIIKKNGAIVLTAQQPFSSRLVMSNFKNFKYEWVWEKSNVSNYANAKKMPLRNHEVVLVFSSGKGKISYNPQGLVDCAIKRNNINKFTECYSTSLNTNYTQTKTGYPKSILKFKSERGLHSTQKPTSLFEYLIRTYTNEGDVVLDSCAGSGTTAIAALRSNRKYICIEKDARYFQVMINRVTEYIK